MMAQVTARMNEHLPVSVKSAESYAVSSIGPGCAWSSSWSSTSSSWTIL